MKSSRCSDEIVRFAHDEIKSVLFIPHISADFIAQRFHPRLRGFNPSVRTDLVENPMLSHRVFGLGNRDSNPNKQSQSLSCCRYTIPQYFQLFPSSADELNYSRFNFVCQHFFSSFFEISAIFFEAVLSFSATRERSVKCNLFFNFA